MKTLFSVVLDGSGHDIANLNEWTWEAWENCTEEPIDDNFKIYKVLRKYIRQNRINTNRQARTVTIFTRNTMSFPCAVHSVVAILNSKLNKTLGGIT